MSRRVTVDFDLANAWESIVFDVPDDLTEQEIKDDPSVLWNYASHVKDTGNDGGTITEIEWEDLPEDDEDEQVVTV